MLLQERIDPCALRGAGIVEVELGSAHCQHDDVLGARGFAVDDLVDVGVEVLVPMRLPAVDVLDALVPGDVPGNPTAARGIWREPL